MPRLNLNLTSYAPTWGSHIVVLLKTFELSTGPVLEMGTGVFSTPLLHALCQRDGRHLVSYDNDPAYVNAHRGFISPGHEVSLIEDWDSVHIENTNWGLVFLDHGPGTRRIIDAEKVAKTAQFVVMHDTELSREPYFTEEAINALFKYRFDYRVLMPNTSVFSNIIDVTNLKI